MGESLTISPEAFFPRSGNSFNFFEQTIRQFPWICPWHHLLPPPWPYLPGCGQQIGYFFADGVIDAVKGFFRGKTGVFTLTCLTGCQVFVQFCRNILNFSGEESTKKNILISGSDP